MAQQKPQAGLLPMVSAFGAVAAPLILAVTGTLYLTAWGERERSLAEFGLSADHFSESLQSTLARGYLPLLAVTLVLLIVLGVLYVAFFATRRQRKPIGGNFAWFDSIGEWLTRLGRWYFYFVCALAVLALGAVAGNFAGQFLANQVKERIASGCRQGCFVYETADRRIIGILIAEDTDRMAVYTARGVALINSADLRAVRAYRPQAPEPRPVPKAASL